jgi:hypothetical protein
MRRTSIVLGFVCLQAIAGLGYVLYGDWINGWGTLHAVSSISYFEHRGEIQFPNKSSVEGADWLVDTLFVDWKRKKRKTAITYAAASFIISAGIAGVAISRRRDPDMQ